MEGIPCFAPTAEFYDDYAGEHCPYATSPTGLKSTILKFLPFWSWREWQFWRRVVPSCNRLLDIGCGRGRQIFVERAGEAFGFDGSLRFAHDCRVHYRHVAVGTLPRLPYLSESFDVVVSSHVMGHVPREEKETLIAEIAQTLRPGGITAHVIETDSAHPVVQAAKGKPAIYRKQFVDVHGHVGLEYAGQVLQRFEKHGLRLRHMRLVESVFPSARKYRTVFNHPDFAGLPGLELSRRLAGWTASSPLANLACEVGMGIFHRTVEQWIGQPSRAQFILVAFDKPL